MRDLPRGTQGHGTGVGSLSLTGLSPSAAGLSMPLLLANHFVTPCGQCSAPLAGPTTPRLQRLQPITQSKVWAPPLSLATTHGMSVCSSRYLDVSVPSVSSIDLLIQSNVPRHYPGWVSPFGHLRVITLARSSPKHFVACHVLHRLLAPRHPPHALSSLT